MLQAHIATHRLPRRNQSPRAVIFDPQRPYKPGCSSRQMAAPEPASIRWNGLAWFGGPAGERAGPSPFEFGAAIGCNPRLRGNPSSGAAPAAREGIDGIRWLHLRARRRKAAMPRNRCARRFLMLVTAMSRTHDTREHRHLPLSDSKADRTRWFIEEVQAHESSLRAYLRGSFPAVRDVDDVVQESYLRIWRANPAEPIRSARAFLFRIAKHLALDWLRHDRVSPVDSVTDFASLPVSDDRPGVAEAASVAEETALLLAAIDALPVRCREIVILRKLRGLSQKEIASQLGLSEQTVQVQIGRGVRRCGEFLRRRGVQR